MNKFKNKLWKDFFLYNYLNDIPFEIASVTSEYHDDSEGATCIDVYPANEDEEGVTVALLYNDGRIVPMYRDALSHLSIVQEIFCIMKNEIFK